VIVGEVVARAVESPASLARLIPLAIGS